MTEYALLNPSGAIVQVVTSERRLDEMRERYPQFDVAYLDDVPMRRLVQYLNWRERP